MQFFIHQRSNWPKFVWKSEELLTKLAHVRHLQGRLLGQMNGLGFDVKNAAFLENLTLDVLKSTEIEGELLAPLEVRSSIARHLGLEIGGLVPSDQFVDGVVEMVLDAAQNFQKPLDAERLFNWHRGLFPTGQSGQQPINVGKYRTDEKGPMQVVSGGIGQERVHFQAPAAEKLSAEMQVFFNFFNEKSELDGVLKAGIAHLWFLTLHPFEDGNGRIGRAILDMQLSKAEQNPQRFYSLSAQISLQRTAYYTMLEKTQRGDLDITHWLAWLLNCLENALLQTETVLEKVLKNARFWEKYAQTVFNERQKQMLQKFLGDFEGKLTSSKYAKMAKCSQDTATRDLQNLVDKNVLQLDTASGRSTNYLLVSVP